MPINFTRFEQKMKSGIPFLVLLCAIWVLAGCGLDELDNDAASTSDGDLQDNRQDDAADGDSLADGEATGNQACSDSDDCDEGYGCHPDRNTCAEIQCSDDSDCEDSFSQAHFCESGFCLTAICETDLDCDENFFCIDGRCQGHWTCSDVADVLIGDVDPLIKSGAERQLGASAFDADGQLIAAASFRWVSVNPEVVSVDPETGAVRGGLLSGTTTIYAYPIIGGEDCQPYGLLDTVSFQNFAPYEGGLRVIVSDLYSGQTVGDATVVVNGEKMKTASDVDCGVTLWPGIEAPYEIHVFQENYHYRSVVGIKQKDVLIPLRPFDGLDTVSGIRGSIDFSTVPSSTKQNIRIAFAGLSEVGSLLDMNMGKLFSGAIMTEVPIDGPFHDVIPLPGNVQIITEIGAARNQIYAQGDSRSTMAWAIGGYMSADDLMELVTERVYAGWGDVGSFIFSAFSFAGSYFHGMAMDLDLTPSHMIADTGDKSDAGPNQIADMNGNGDTDDLVPDYGRFDALEEAIELNMPLDYQLKVHLGDLPDLAGMSIDGIFVLVGARTLDGQFIPLGLGSKAIELESSQNKPSAGTGGDVLVDFSHSYGHLYSRFTVIAFALPLTDLFHRDGGLTPYSAVIRHFDEPPGEVDMGDFLSYPSWAHVSTEERKLRYIVGEGADFHRALFSNHGRNWEILIGERESEFSDREIILPEPPGDDPFLGTADIMAAELPGVITLGDLAAFNSERLKDLDRYVRRHSVYRIEKELLE